MKNLNNSLTFEYYDNHGHIFDKKCVSPGFLGWRWLQRVINKHTMPIALFLKCLVPTSRQDVLHRYASFLQNEGKSQVNNLKEWEGSHKKNTRLTVLTIDMNGLGVGETEKPFRDQVLEIIELKKRGKKIQLFLHIDPNTGYALDLLQELEPWIDGIKIYNNMGHFPYGDVLYTVYQWCAMNNKPVMLHASPGTPVHFKGKKKEILKRLDSSLFPLALSRKKNPSKKELCNNFINPLGFEKILLDFPKVNFCFAHMGGEEEIEKHLSGRYSYTSSLLRLIYKYDNAYTDTSYSFHKPEYHNFLKTLLKSPMYNNKILYGTDFYMYKTATTDFKDYFDNLIAVIGVEGFKRIALSNVNRYFKDKES